MRDRRQGLGDRQGMRDGGQERDGGREAGDKRWETAEFIIVFFLFDKKITMNGGYF